MKKNPSLLTIAVRVITCPFTGALVSINCPLLMLPLKLALLPDGKHVVIVGLVVIPNVPLT